jgi:hypothetical protein
MAAGSATRARPVAGTIGLLFGGLWSLLGALGLPQGVQLPTQAVGWLITLALTAALWWRREAAGPGPGLFRRRGYLIAVTLEVVAIYAASTLLTRYGLKTYVIQAVGVIVGLHFIGLWQARFLWIAGGMCAVSALAACLPDALNGFNPRNAVTGFGNALVLWVGAGRSMRTDGPNRQTAAPTPPSP